MSRFVQGWSRILIVLVSTVLLLAGCSGAPRGIGGPGPLGDDAPVVTVNVSVTDDAIEPSTIRIRAGKPIQLILRNYGTTEHHVVVKGLSPKELSWVLVPDPNAPRISDISDQNAEHASHNHLVTYVPFRPASPAGVKVTGKEVHVYAQRSTVDAVMFTATAKGTYTVVCPLHPKLSATVTVY